MREFDECKAEIFRRSEQKKERRKKLIKVISCCVAGCILIMTVFHVFGPNATVRAKDLMEGIVPNQIWDMQNMEDLNTSVTDFAVRLFQTGEKSGENTLISPLSVLCALAMTANGAEGDTRMQMEEAFGVSIEDLNLYLYTYIKNLPQQEEGKLSVANSIWISDKYGFSANRGFLQTNADYYGADIYEAPFNARLCNNINNWVDQKTDGMIPQILDSVSDSDIMYLINALAFEAEWQVLYEKKNVKEGIFTKENGTEQSVDFMHSTESVYLEDEKATGFMKYYSSRKYAFVAILPKEGVSVSEYIASLDGEALSALLAGQQNETVQISLPKFETESDMDMSEILQEMGMVNAFDSGLAELEGMGTLSEGNLFIGGIRHKAYISVGERGTKAGAVTEVYLNGGPGFQTKEIHLNRPFVYMLIDCENKIPFFIGTMMDVEQ